MPNFLLVKDKLSYTFLAPGTFVEVFILVHFNLSCSPYIFKFRPWHMFYFKCGINCFALDVHVTFLTLTKTLIIKNRLFFLI